MMPEPLEMREFVVNAVAEDLQEYETRAALAKRSLMWRVSLTRALGALALCAVLVSATRLDQIMLTFAGKQVDQTTSNQVGLVITAFALLIGAVTAWWARAVRDRGYLHAWVRYSLTAQTLRAHRHEMELAWRRFSALAAPSEEDRKEVIAQLARASSQAKQATLEETKNWATNLTEDLGEYLKGALRIAETIDEARERTKPSG